MPAAHLHWRPHVDLIAPNNLIQAARSPPVEVAKLEKLALLYQFETSRRFEMGFLRRVCYAFQVCQWLAGQRTKALSGKYMNVPDCARLALLNSKKAEREIEVLKKSLL